MQITIGLSITAESIGGPSAPPSAPVNLSVPMVTPSSGNVNDVLTCSIGAWSGIPSPTFTYQWFVDGAEAVGEANATITAASAGSYTCRVTATNSEGSASETSNASTIAAATLPANTVQPTVSPSSGTVGEVLSVTDGTWTGNPAPTFIYQWQLDGSDVAGATQSTVTTNATGSWTCIVTATNSAGSTDATSNASTISAALAAPTNTAAPSISPTSATVDDQPFTRVAGTYTGNPAPTVTWVWRKGITQIPGTLNEATYTPDEARSDYNVYETASNSEGSVNAGSADASATLRTQATMVLADQTFTQNTGNQNYDVSADVTANGNSLDYSLLAPPAGVTIVGPVVMVDTTVLAAGTQPITVRATDEYGRTNDDNFDLVISAASATQDFAIQHFSPTVAAGGGNQAITEITSVDGAVVLINNAARTGAGNTTGTNGEEPDEGGLGLRLTSTTNVAMDRDSNALLDNMASFSVWEYIGDPGGPNEFIVRDRRTVTLTSETFSYTPTGIVNANKCIPIITGSRNNRPNGSQWDHALAATSINRSTGQVTVEGRDDQGNFVVEITLVEFTGSNWTVHYATESADSADTGTLTLDGSVASWADAMIISQFAKNGGNNGGVADVHPMYKPAVALNQVNWAFHNTHTGTSDQRHTVYVLENSEMTVTRFQDDHADPAPTTANVDISSAGLTATTEGLLFITTAAEGIDSGHLRGQRNVAFVDANTVRQYASKGALGLETEIQVVKLPNIGSPGSGTSPGGGGSPPSSGSSLPPVPEYPDSNFTVINLSSGANIQSTINGLSSLEGVKIKLAAGSYASFAVDFALHGNATLANPFVIEGAGQDQTRILDNPTGDSVLIAGVEHVILDKMFIEGAPNASRSALHVRLKNAGIYPRGFQLLRSTIARRTGDGIKFSEVFDTLVDSCIFSDELKTDTTGERHLDFNKFDNMELYRCTFLRHRALNVKGGSRNAIIAECDFVECNLTVEIGEREGNGYWDIFDDIRDWAVIGTSIKDCTFDNCTGVNIKFKDVHDYVAEDNRQLSSGPGATDATYQFLSGNQIGQSDYENKNIAVDRNLLFADPVTSPSAFGDADWSVAASGTDTLNVSISKLPINGGATITDVEYDLNADGTWVSSGGVGNFTITGLSEGTSYNLRLRAVNSVGSGASGNIESATTEAGNSPTAPAAFVDANWSVASSGSDTLSVTIASLPNDGGATITDVQYELGASGTWISSGGTGNFSITGLSASTAYNVRLRAVNSVGSAVAGNSESATTDASASNDFEFVVRTTTANETVTIPCQNVGTFNATMTAANANVPHNTGASITAWNDSNLTMTFATAGDHTVTISGDFPNVYFNNSGDNEKLISVQSLGALGWITFSNAFYNCVNMTSFNGAGNTSSVTNMVNMFLGCSGLTSLDVSSFDTSSVTNMSTMFRGCSGLTSLDVSSFDTSSVTNMANMFRGCSGLNTNPSTFNITALNNTANLNNFMLNSGMTTANYDATLIAWAGQNVLSGLSPNFGSSQYTAGGAAEAARTSLINDDGWTITDGGPA